MCRTLLKLFRLALHEVQVNSAVSAKGCEEEEPLPPTVHPQWGESIRETAIYLSTLI